MLTAILTSLPDFPDDCRFSEWFQNCPDFSRWLPMSGNLDHASRLLCLFRLLLNAGIARSIERSRGSWIGSFAFRQPPNQTPSRHRVTGTNEEYCYSEAKIQRSESKCPNFRGIEIWQRLQTIENSDGLLLQGDTLTFSTSLQWGTHQTTSTSTFLPILILLLLLFLSL